MISDDEQTLVFRSVSTVLVKEAGQKLAIEFVSSSGQAVSVVIPAEASHMLSRMLMRAQIEAAAERVTRSGHAPSGQAASTESPS
jgi:hypothetical protein